MRQARPVVTAGLAAAAWAASVGLSSAGVVDGCHRAGGERIWTSGSRSVLVYRSSGEARDAYSACWKKTGVIRRLDTVRYGGPVVAGFVASGPWLAWSRASTNTAGETVLRSMNVKTGHAGPAVTFDNARAIGSAGGPPPSLDPPAYVVAANGSFAWLVSGKTTSGAFGDAMFAATRAGTRRVDRGRLGQLSALRTHATTLSWRHGGERRTASLSG